MPVSPSAIIFDYGNVLCQSQPPADTDAMAAILGLSLEQFNDLYWRFRIPYDSGTLNPAAYWNELARATSRKLTSDQIATLTEIDSRSWSHPARVMPQWARDLRAAGLRTALLSNMPVAVKDYVLGCSWLPDFDARVFSCDVGTCKPEPGMYRECLAALGLQPSEVLFFDDREPNVRAAQALGLHAVLFTNPSDAARQIKDRFRVPIPLTLE